MSVNKAILVGRLGRDPEARFTSGGQQICNFSIATDETYKDRSGERQKKTEWHRITCFAKLAEIVQQYAKKGTMVYVEGRIQYKQWEKDGVKKSGTDIVANTVTFLSSKSDTPEAQGDGDPGEVEEPVEEAVGF